MKKLLLPLVYILCVCAPFVVKSQSFTQPDTAKSSAISGAVAANITVTGTSDLNIKYKITATNFPADWLTAAALGLCDMSQCRNNISESLWNSTTHSGTAYNCTYPGGATNTFSLSPDLTTATTLGCYYMTVNVAEAGVGGYSHNVTFVICKNSPTAVPTVTSEERTALYPNPANNEVNVIFDAGADVKNVAIYNIIGKMMNVYKVTDNTSANLKIDNLPSGIYFVKLYNGAGNVVVTRKFTKQ